MSDMGDMMALGAKIVGAFALAAAAVIGTAGYIGYESHQENKTAAALAMRANDTLQGKSLTLITMDKFKKGAGCDAAHPYGADFTAKDASGKVVQGHICSAPDRESTLTLKP